MAESQPVPVDYSSGHIKPFSVVSEPLTVGSRWKKWKRGFQYFVEARGIKDAKQKKALLLDRAGEEVQDIFDILPAADGSDEYAKTVEALDKHFEPKTNVPYERAVFRRTEINDGETITNYITRLRQLAVTCEFSDLDDTIRDQVIEKCKDNALRTKLLERGSGLKLTDVISISQSHESVARQSKDIGNKSMVEYSNGSNAQAVNKVGSSKQIPANIKRKGGRICYRCKSNKHLSSSQDCPARNKLCNYCGQRGHFSGSQFCKGDRTQSTATVDDNAGQDSDESVDALFTICDDLEADVVCTTEDDNDGEMFKISNQSARINVDMNGITVPVLIDSGACSNLIDKHTADLLKCLVKPTSKKLYGYGNRSRCIDLVGETIITVFVPSNGKSTTTVFYVFNGTATTLLSKRTSELLDVLRVGPVVGAVVGATDGLMGSGVQPWVAQFPECFDGVGLFKGFQVSLHIDSTVEPVVQPVRRVPFGLRKQLKARLDELLEADIIEIVEGGQPTSWLSPIVVVSKDDGKDIRLCVDMRVANKAIKRERHPIPTLKELLYNLNGAKHFSKVDLKQAFHQFELDDASREITTFSTPFGLYRYKRLMFGIASAPEIVQYQIQKAISGLAGCQNYADDIVIWGETKLEHEQRVKQFLERMGSLGLTLNAKKCEFGSSKVSFLGFDISADGVSPSSEKVQSILKAREPRDITELRSFLGLVNFVGRFIPHLSTHAEALLRLTKKGVNFKFGQEQKVAFEKIKVLMSQTKTLAFYDANLHTNITVDASPYGLGAILSQTIDGLERVIAYGHRSLSKVERRYSQTEREALAIVWGCEHFSMYLLGVKFKLVTDHRPLQFIFNRLTSRPSARIERWVLRLMAFDYEVVYKPGHGNIADPLSRLSVDPQIESDVVNVADAYIMTLATESLPKAMSFTTVKEESLKCTEIKQVRRALTDGIWASCLPAYRSIYTELSEIEGVLMRGNRIVMPVSLRGKAVELAHEGHQGITKTKQLLRSKVWWPGMDSEAEKVCRECYECQVVSAPTRPPPMTSTRMPDGPWQHIACDLMGPLPNGESLLVAVDYYSRYFEVNFMRSTTSSKVIVALETMFCRWGVPLSIRTDNGPQFTGQEFQQFLQQYGVYWLSTTPMWPAANGEVERQNRSLLKSLKIAQISGKDYKAELRKFLLAYRSTPHSVTGVSPGELMIGRPIRGKLPCLERSNEADGEIRDKQALSQERRSSNADRSSSEIEVGDKVLVRQAKVDKLTPTFKPHTQEVVAKQGSEVVVRDKEGKEVRRNISETKKLVVSDAEGNSPTVAGEAEDLPVEDLPTGRPVRSRSMPQRYGNPLSY